MSTAVIRIDYHDDDKSRILAECLVPALADAGDDGTVAWLQFHWLHGPHILVHIMGPDEAVAARQARLTEVVRQGLAAFPSRRAVDPDAYLALSQGLGRLELVEPPYGPVRPDNTVSPGVARTDTFITTPEALHAKGRILARALADPEFVRLVGGAANERTLAVFAGMGSIAVSYPVWGLVSGYQAFLSHWKEQLFWIDPEGVLEHAFERSFDRQRQTLVDLLTGIRDGDRRFDDVGAGRMWRRWLGAAWPEADRLARAGHVLPYPLPARHEQATRIDEETGVRWSGSDERDYSDFHRQFRKLDFTRLGNGTDFAAYRFLINCFFDLLPLIAISPRERYAIAFLFTSAAQDVVGETWEETIERAVRRQAAEGNAVPTLPWRDDVA